MEESAQQSNNSKPWLFKKGQSGNPSGRPKGSISLKEYARKMLSEMDEEQKAEFMDGLSKDTIWKMAEGNPDTKNEHAGEVKTVLVMPSSLIQKNDITPATGPDSPRPPQV